MLQPFIPPHCYSSRRPALRLGTGPEGDLHAPQPDRCRVSNESAERFGGRSACIQCHAHVAGAKSPRPDKAYWVWKVHDMSPNMILSTQCVMPELAEVRGLKLNICRDRAGRLRK